MATGLLRGHYCQPCQRPRARLESHNDLYITTQSVEEADEPVGRKAVQVAVAEGGDLRLPVVEELRCLYLCESPGGDHVDDLAGELRLGQMRRPVSPGAMPQCTTPATAAETAALPAQPP